MMPITRVTTRSFQPNYNHHQSSEGHPWAVWEKQIAPGMSEQREIAVRRLQDCLKNNTPTLDLSFLNLTELPENLPNCLILDVSFNQLSRLPENLPHTLTELHAIHNSLLILPENLPNSLTILNVRHNQLTYLPTLPSSLKELDIKENLFSTPVLKMLLSNSYDLVSKDFLSTDFMKKINLWSKGDLNESNLKEWAAIQWDDRAYNFSYFLEILYQHKNKHNMELKHRVLELLHCLIKAENTALRELIFFIASEATGTCVDRVSFYFNKMHIAMIEHKLSLSDVSIKTLIKTNLILFRMQILEKIVAEYIKQIQIQLPEISEEELEVYLMYQYKLRDKLSLPIYTKQEYEWNIGSDAFNCAYKKVKAQEKEYFLRYLLIESSSWNAKLVDWNKEEKERLDNIYLDEISGHKLEEKIDEILNQQRISLEDTDARHAIGKKLCEDMLFEKRYRLTCAFLIENNALSLITKYDEKIHKKRGFMARVQRRFL